MSIDESEAIKLGWKHFEKFKSKIQAYISKDYPLSDAFCR